MIKKLLIIAGSDPSGGAGIQADIKTATAHKVYAAAVITCLTAQNTARVSEIFNPPVSFLRAQLDAVLDDIKFDAIKIGMLGSVDIIECVAEVLAKKAQGIPLVLDPVMVATSGDLLLERNAVDALKSRLVNGSFLVTPNIDEAKILAGIKINNIDDMKRAAFIIKGIGAKNVLIKGGHLNLANDKKITNILLNEKGKFYEITNKKIAIGSVHGTGCALACAIACNVAKKMALKRGVKKANDYVYKALSANLKVGNGSNVLKHFV